MSEPFLAEIRIFAGNFAPRGWAFCNGQLLPIAQNTALFSIARQVLFQPPTVPDSDRVVRLFGAPESGGLGVFS